MTKRRPLGVTLLAVLALLMGLIYLIGALGSFLIASLDLDEMEEAIGDQTPQFIIENAGLVFASLGAIFLALAVISFLFAFGLLRGSRWAWLIGIVIGILSIVMYSINMIINMSLSSIVSSSFAILIAALILYYLTRPRIKAFFI